MMATVLRVLVLSTVMLLGACGPIAYINEVTRKASTAVDRARAVEADKYAPYWWTRATQYLVAAREDAARADFQGANRFGRLAREAAEKAVEEAAIASKDASRRPLEGKQPGADAELPPTPVKDAP